ncbi:MAG: acetolactate synthase [Chloroflexi bacterium]|nr:acetolactate synthase [Chloroflexota bacterium]
MSIHGGQIVAKALKRAGVEVIFTLSGGHIMPIYDGCLDEGIRIIDVRHEQAAVHAADAWARLTGKPGVAVLTAGPGVTDGVTGVANAFRANSPVLVIGGQGPFAQVGRGSLQEMDHVSLMRPITKWSGAGLQTERLAETIETAMRYMFAGRYGPAFLEIPLDILMNYAGESEAIIPPFDLRRPPCGTSSAATRQAMTLLAGAARPILMAGGQVKWCNAYTPLQRLAERLHLPVFTNGMGRGAMPPDSPQFFSQARRTAFDRTDLLILAGGEFDFRLNFGADLPATARVIQIDPDPTIIGLNRSVDLGLVGDIAVILEQLDQALAAEQPHLRFSAWRDSLRVEEENRMAKLLARATSQDIPIDPVRLCYEIAALIDRDTIVIGDGGDIVSTAAKVIPVHQPGAWMDPGPLGCLGVGMPFALAAQLAFPERKILVIFGDGAFGLNGFEFDTAVRFKLPIMSVVGNDAAWGQMRRPQIALYGKDRAVATSLAPTRYDKVVEALGGWGACVDQPDQIAPALAAMTRAGLPACVNVMIAQLPPDVSQGKYF